MEKFDRASGSEQASARITTAPGCHDIASFAYVNAP
jgi:hypothetical protein